MADRLEQLKGFFSSHLPTLRFRCVKEALASTPFTLACLGVLLLPLGIWLLFSVIYIGAFLYGLLSGHTFPSREIFLFFPSLASVFAQPESLLQPPFLAKVLFFYACAGFLLSSLLQRGNQQEIWYRLFARSREQWSAISILLVCSLLFATMGEESFSYASDSGYFLFAGHVPFSDANDFYRDYAEYFYTGMMNDHGLRRPVAAFMGATIYWLAGNNPAIALQLQCLLLCFALWVSCATVNKFFGVWSSIACLALEYGYCCLGKYSFNFMTEPLGFFWGAIAAALWLQAMHEKRLFWDLAAFSATLIGLLTRMGTMFLVPALFLYILWRWRTPFPARGWWKKPLCGLSICIIAIAMLNMVFASRGNGDSQQTGSNFAYSFAGLTLGGNWYTAYKLYEKQLQALPDEKQQSRFLYSQGVENLLHSPDVFFIRVGQGEWGFLRYFNFYLFHKWALVCLVGALLIIRRKIIFTKITTVFWVAIWGGIALSIPFIYFDGYSRIIFFIYPLVACFFSLALAQRNDVPLGADPHIAGAIPRVAVGLSCALLLLMVSVALFPRLHMSEDIQRMKKYAASLPKKDDSRFLVDARNMALLVVPDGVKPDPIVPSMTWSTFKAKYKKFAPAVYEDLFTGAFPKPPFVALTQVPLSGPKGRFNCFIAPPEVMSQKAVLLWDLETAAEIKAPKGGLWKIVAKATPVLYK